MRNYGQFCPVARGSEILAERWTEAFSFLGRKRKGWLLIERREGELCRVDPGFGDDVVVTINDPLMFTHWHMGRVEWPAALRSGGVQVSGPRALCRALPTWNSGPEKLARRRAVLKPSPVGVTPRTPQQTLTLPS